MRVREIFFAACDMVSVWSVEVRRWLVMEPVQLAMAAIAIALLQLWMTSLSPVSNLTYVSKFTPRNQSIIQEISISSNFSSQCSNLLAVFSLLPLVLSGIVIGRYIRIVSGKFAVTAGRQVDK